MTRLRAQLRAVKVRYAEFLVELARTLSALAILVLAVLVLFIMLVALPR
jgi:hypothetical protein